MGGRNAAQEQASAVAALQHQQQQNQHRANLLGSMNGQAGGQLGGNQARVPSGGQGGFFAEGDKTRVSFIPVEPREWGNHCSDRRKGKKLTSGAGICSNRLSR